MCLTGTLLRGVLGVLLLAGCWGKRGCNFREILDSYKVILIELRNLNLTGSSITAKERDPCPSGKARRILVSIYGMTQQIRCQTSNQRSIMEKPVQQMEQLIIQNCGSDPMVTHASCSTVRKIKGKKRKRLRLIKVIKQLMTCWQRLMSVYTPSK